MNSRKRLILRADACPRIGLGHVMRCLTLGEEWVSRGGEATLVGRVMGSAVMRRLSSASIECLDPGVPTGSNADLAVLADVAREAGAVVVDGYDFGAEYFDRLVTDSTLVVIDDDGETAVPESALIVNHHQHAGEAAYARRATGAIRALGPTFALLRREFREVAGGRQPEPARGTKVLVTLGGSDRANVTHGVLRELANIRRPELRIRVVLGPSRPGVIDLADVAAAGVEVVVDPPSLAPHFLWADVAIAGGGGTALELACAGVPALLLSVAQNQRPVAASMDRAGAAIDAGEAPAAIVGLATALTELLDDQFRRKALSDAGQQLVDGRGAKRVVDLLSGMVDGRESFGLRVRPTLVRDEAAVLLLANSPGARENSLTAREIGVAEHRKWFATKIASEDTRMWVLDVGDSLAGQVRYDRTGSESAEVHITIAPEWRGRGLAKSLLRMTTTLAFASLRVTDIDAVIAADNAPSLRAFESVGFCRRDGMSVRGKEFLRYRLVRSSV